NQCGVADGPVELVSVAHVEGCLVDGLAPDDRVAMLQDEAGKLPVRYAQCRGRGIEGLAQLGSDLLRDRPIAGRGDDSLTAREMADNGAQAAVGQNKIRIEKDLPMLDHRRTKITESSMQCIGERHSVLVFRHDQIVESEESNGTDIPDTSDRW